MPRISLFPALLIAGALLPATADAAPPTWTVPSLLSPATQHPESAKLAASHDGVVTALWAQGSEARAAWSASRASGKEWSFASQVPSFDAARGTGSLDVADGGAAATTWVDAAQRGRIAFRLASGAWSQPFDADAAPDPANFPLDEPRTDRLHPALLPGGTALVSWHRTWWSRGTPTSGSKPISSEGGVRVVSPTTASDENGPSDPFAVASDSAGRATYFVGAAPGFDAIARDADGTWSEPVPVDHSLGAVFPMEAAQNASGDAVVAWLGHSRPGPSHVLVARRVGPHGTFGTATDLGEQAGGDLQVGLDDAGTATVAWSLGSGSLKVARVSPDGTATTPEPFGDARSAQFDLSVGPNGRTALGYTEDGHAIVQTREASGAWERTDFGEAANTADDPVRVAATDADVTATWTTRDGDLLAARTKQPAPAPSTRGRIYVYSLVSPLFRGGCPKTMNAWVNGIRAGSLPTFIERDGQCTMSQRFEAPAAVKPRTYALVVLTSATSFPVITFAYVHPPASS